MPYLLSVCEAGSLAGAARMLGVNHSTVFRRIEAVEARLGVRLFERLARGYVMTPAGERFYERAIVLCGGMDEIERDLGGRDLRLEGPLTVTTTDSLLHCLLLSLLNSSKHIRMLNCGCCQMCRRWI
ncbi:MAG: LysR family transcriptional regulator [Pseudomonadota bacterium]